MNNDFKWFDRKTGEELSLEEVADMDATEYFTVWTNSNGSQQIEWTDKTRFGTNTTTQAGIVALAMEVIDAKRQ